MSHSAYDSARNDARTRGVSRRNFLSTATAAGAVFLARPARGQAQGGIPDQVTVIQVDEATSLNPLAEFANPGLMVHGHLYEPLVDFTGPDLRVTPKLALSWDNPKPTLWRFKLRPNVVWHDGTPFTADDVRFTLEEGKKPTSVKSRFLARVQKVEVLDPLTVQVEMDEPYAPILASWAYLYIVQKKAYEALGAAEYGASPSARARIGWSAGSGNSSSCSRRSTGTGAARTLPSGSSCAACASPAPASPSCRPAARTSSWACRSSWRQTVQADPALNLVVLQGIRTPYFPFNNKRPPFEDRRVRQAMNYALDREALVQGILQGYGEVRGGPFSRSDPVGSAPRARSTSWISTAPARS